MQRFFGYRGHVANFEQKSLEWFDNLPPAPKDLPLLLVRRVTREPTLKRMKRPPFMVHRGRLTAALAVLRVPG
jgi:hypothetical protein